MIGCLGGGVNLGVDRVGVVDLNGGARIRSLLALISC